MDNKEKTMLALKCKFEAEECVRRANLLLNRLTDKTKPDLAELGDGSWTSESEIKRLKESIAQDQLNIERYDKWLSVFGTLK